jgi:Tol biopolymer transport system component/C-terminal processing protease CtpA/Prc
MNDKHPHSQDEHQNETHGTPPTEGIPYFRMPALSPDGQSLVFVHAHDIWQVSIAGGTAERLPIHYVSHWVPRFSPDGTLLAFTSYRTGGGDIYVFPTGGGEVRQLTSHSSFCSVDDWSADGKYLYFTAQREQLGGEEIYCVSLDGGTPALVLVEPHETLEHVSASPDGRTLAFNTTHNPWWRLGPSPFAPCYIWLMDIGERGSQPQETKQRNPQEAPEPGNETPPPFVASPWKPDPLPFARGRWPMWAPDGAGVYFVSDRGGTENIWYQPRGGQEAQQVTHFADGRVLWPAIARNAGTIVFERAWQIWHLDLASGEAAPIPIRVRADTRMTPVRTESWSRYFSELSLSPDGKKIAFIARGQVFADFSDKETDRDLRQGPAFRITNLAARHSDVTWTPDSNRLVYVSDRHGEDELFGYDFRTRTETRMTHHPSSKGLPCCSPDGVWVAYFDGFETIALLNLQTGETRPFVQGNFQASQGLAWSPDSRWLAYLSHDARFFCNAYVQRLDETEPHQITFLSNFMGYGLMWSSDGRFLIFTSGQYRLESQIVRVDLTPPRLFFREDEFEKLFGEEPKEQPSQSPPEEEQPARDQDEEEEEDEDEPDQPEEPEQDGQRAAEPGQPEEPERSPDREPDPDSPSPSPPASEPQQEAPQEPQEKKPEPVDIVFEGIERRLSFLTPVQMDAKAQAISHDSRDLLFLAEVAGKINIWTLPLDEPRRGHPPQQMTADSSGKRHLQFVPNDKHFFYLEDGQITIRKFPSGRDPLILYTRGEVTVDFEQEKVQVFGEAWRLLRDMFYDPTFRGQDWNAIRERFAPLAAGVRTPGELTTVLNLMVGELRSSHVSAFWRSGGQSDDGYTGVLFDPVTLIEQGSLRVAGLVPDSPAALLKDPPQVGDYLVAVDGTPLTPSANLDHLLQRTVGRKVVLRLASTPGGSETREVAVRPIDEDAYEHLRYRAWVETNEAYVHRVSQGRLGYVHVPEMSYEAYQQFLVNLDVETHSKEGVVLDIRYNSGGHIATFILDVLTRQGFIVSGFRGRLSTDAYHFSGNRSLNKPTVLVTNESSASNAEMFTEIYRRLGLGKVVGKPTAGAVIWTTERTLLNRISFRLPRYSVSTPEGEDLEGTGRDVDVEVDQAPGEWSHGRDHQLEAAVAVLLESLGAQSQHAV